MLNQSIPLRSENELLCEEKVYPGEVPFHNLIARLTDEELYSLEHSLRKILDRDKYRDELHLAAELIQELRRRHLKTLASTAQEVF